MTAMMIELGKGVNFQFTRVNSDRLCFLNKDYHPFSGAHVHLIHNWNIKAEIRRQIIFTAGSSIQCSIYRGAPTILFKPCALALTHLNQEKESAHLHCVSQRQPTSHRRALALRMLSPLLEQTQLMAAQKSTFISFSSHSPWCVAVFISGRYLKCIFSRWGCLCESGKEGIMPCPMLCTAKVSIWSEDLYSSLWHSMSLCALGPFVILVKKKITWRNETHLETPFFPMGSTLLPGRKCVLSLHMKTAMRKSKGQNWAKD